MYVELIVITDVFMNYLVITTTGLILNRISEFKKIFLSSVIGAIPLILLCTNIKPIIYHTTNIIFAFIMSIISFKYKDILYTIKNVIYMYFVSVFLAGSIYLVNETFLPNINNQILSLIIMLIISPIITTTYNLSLHKLKTINSNYYKLDIYLKDGNVLTVSAYLDTGNKLVSPYSNTPIILLNKQIIEEYIPKNIILVPCNTISGNSMLPCFYPEKIYIYGLGFFEKVLIGLTSEFGIEGIDCLLNYKLLERINWYDFKTIKKNL